MVLVVFLNSPKKGIEYLVGCTAGMTEKKIQI